MAWIRETQLISSTHHQLAAIILTVEAFFIQSNVDINNIPITIINTTCVHTTV